MDWFKEQDENTQEKVQLRLERLALEGHFGVTNFFDGIIELKWKSGLRVYLARVRSGVIAVLLGGTKHGQNKDIKKVKRTLKEIQESNSIPS
jgi:putative addiction module killer protein